jgi:hypothetical protein
VGVFNYKDIYCEMKQLIRHILREHIIQIKESQTNWTLEKILELSKDFTKMNDFKKSYPNAYAALRRRVDWLNKVKENMTPAYINWTKELIHQEALKFPTRRQFQTHSKKAYNVARYNGWLDDVTSHMTNMQNLWNPDDIWKEALKYNHVRDFIEGSKNAYQAARRRPNYKEIISHMTPLGNKLKRLIYSYEFPDNTVYVGLTFDLGERDRQHRKKENSQVYKHIKQTGLEPNFKQITDKFVSALDAKVLEQQTIEKYANDGWKILNLAKAGGLGSSVLDNWTKEMVIEVAKKYNTKTEFCKKERRACMLAKRNGWYDDATNHMETFSENWDFEKIHNEALKYKNRNEFKKNSPKAYRAALNKNIIDDVTIHMGQPKIFGPHNAIWDRDLAEKEIQKYKTISDLKSKNNSLYSAIHRFGWQDLLDSLESKIINWTPDKIFDEAKKYNRVIEFRDGSPKAYGAAKRLNLIPDIRNIYGQKERLSPKK